MGRLMLLAAALALGLAACGADAEEPERVPQGDGGAAGLAGPLVYSRGGGFDGRNYRLTIAPDGRGRLELARGASRDVRIEPEALQAVARRLGAADLPAEPATFQPERPAPDAFGHRVVYGGRTLTVSDAARGVPEPVGALVGELSSLLDRLRA